MTTPTQQDIEAAHNAVLEAVLGIELGNTGTDWLALCFMRHRLAAEQAQRDRDARIGYRVCAETRHVRLGDAVAAAIRGDEA